MAVEEFALCAHAHGVEPQQNFLQQFRRVELIFGFVIALKLVLNKGVKVGQNGIVCGCQSSKIGTVADAEFFVQLAQHDFNGVNMAVREILIASKEILEKADVLTELGGLTECLGRISVLRAAAFIPGFWLQRVNDIPV